jgi:hypothetical protein
VWLGTQGTDYNGIVLFDPAALHEFYGRIQRGASLFRRFTETDDGDQVLERGMVVPILAIDDPGYSLVFATRVEESPVEPWVVVTNGVFPFWVSTRRCSPPSAGQGSTGGRVRTLQISPEYPEPLEVGQLRRAQERGEVPVAVRHALP